MNEGAADPTGPETEAGAADFDETAYLTAFPKIAENIRAGALKSAYDHYLRRGAAERRLETPRYRKALAEQILLARLSAPAGVAPDATANAGAAEAGSDAPAGARGAMRLDALLVAVGGTCLAVGWVDDRGAPLSAITLVLPDGRVVHGATIARCRRTDAEAAIGGAPGALLGFYALITLDQPEPAGAGTSLRLHCGQEVLTLAARPQLVPLATLRDRAFECLGEAAYQCARPLGAFLQLQGGFGDALIALSRGLSQAIVARPFVERHGNHARPFCASVIVCLYGRLDYLFLQAALFSAAPGAAAYEYVYVSNSPELTDTLQNEARLAARLYDLAITLVILPGNAGFGAANNAAVQAAASRRVIMLNPDVFPMAPDWAAAHRALVDGLPRTQTAVFGVPMFYDDGALMHGGMFFESDAALCVTDEGITRQALLRVEHYGKGAPPDCAPLRAARTVPAVTGAFISADRTWFERLGGFAEDYALGHYEDADLCLRTWQAGGEVWLHDLPFRHLEGKGSTKRPAGEGGALLNRWHFTRLWLPVVLDGLLGPDPARLARARVQ